MPASRPDEEWGRRLTNCSKRMWVEFHKKEDEEETWLNQRIPIERRLAAALFIHLLFTCQSLYMKYIFWKEIISWCPHPATHFLPPFIFVIIHETRRRRWNPIPFPRIKLEIYILRHNNNCNILFPKRETRAKATKETWQIYERRSMKKHDFTRLV